MKKYCFFSLIALTCALSAVAVTAVNENQALRTFAYDDYELSMTSANRLTVSDYQSGEYVVKTNNRNDIVLGYSNARGSENNHIELSNGKLFNKTIVSSVHSVLANFTGNLTLKLGIEEGIWNKTVSLTSGVIYDTKLDSLYYNYFELSGTATISNFAVDYECLERSQTIELTVPEVTNVVRLDTEEVDIPVATAKNNWQEDLSNYIKVRDVTDPHATITNGKLTATKAGVHNIEYSLVNEKGQTLKTTTKQVNIDLKVAYNYNTFIPFDIEGVGASAIYSAHDSSNGVGILNLNFEPSTYYYAEFTMLGIAAENYKANQTVAGAHGLTENVTPTQGKGLTYTGFKFNAENYEVAIGKWMDGSHNNGSWDPSTYRQWFSTNFFNRREEFRNNPININNDTKIALARIGNDLYTFVNDKILLVQQYNQTYNVPSKPAIFFDGKNLDTTHLKFTNFSFLKEEQEVINKINSLSPTSWDTFITEETQYQPVCNMTDKIQGGIQYNNEATLNNWPTNGSTSPFLNLNGDWTLSFDVNNTALGDNGIWGKFFIDIITTQDRKGVFEIANELWTGGIAKTSISRFVTDSKYFPHVGHIYPCPEGYSFSTIDSTYYENTMFHLIDAGAASGTMAKNNAYFFPRFATIKVTIKCVQNPYQNNEMYTLSYEYQGKTLSVTFPVNYESDAQPLINNLPSSGKLLVFRTQKWAGTVTNLKVTY